MPLHDRIIPYLERAGLYHLARLNVHWFWLDEPLVSAFIERWRPETHIFHMLFGECTITFQDVAYQLGLPMDGQVVSGCMTDFHLHIEETGMGVVPGVIWPQPADVPSQVPESQLPVDLNEPAGSPYDPWFGMGDAAICIWSWVTKCSTRRSASD
ncbi:hypothetical protein Ahy_A03g016702 [Arachis hypogaea]|uniref:Aminotransferase-like plant mobile domain-containing protein n=1 Tax=Arachis hypogaea TaxID=3818 RepID=A0A445E439_ARAHY|nr:hypothetical protein Ahy_A03g016702 [Arachis hypogaea]